MGRRARQFSLRFAVVSVLGCVGTAVNRRRNHAADKVDFTDAEPRPAIPSREQRWKSATREDGVDVVVIGANAAGLWATLDAAARGLSVCLVEANDFGSGSTTRTPRLVQSGMHDLQRALRRRDIILFLGAIDNQSELQTLTNIAPRLVKPVDVVVPVYRTTEFVELVICAVTSAFLSLTTSGWRWPSLWGKSELKTTYPALTMEYDEYEAQGAVVTRHALIDDSRLAVELACEASKRGATVLNHAVVTGFDLRREPRTVGIAVADKDRYWYSAKAAYNAWRDGSAHNDSTQDAVLAMNRAIKGRDTSTENEIIDKIQGVHVTDAITGAKHTIKCRAVINCAGHRTDDIRHMVNPDDSARNFAHFSSAITFLVSRVLPDLNAAPQPKPAATEDSDAPSPPATPPVPRALLVNNNHVDAKSFFVIPHFDPRAGNFIGAVDSAHRDELEPLEPLRGVESPMTAKPVDVDFVRGALNSFGIAASERINAVLSPVTPLFHMPSRNPEPISECIRFGKAVELKYVDHNLVTGLGANWITARGQAARMVDVAWTDILHRPTDIVSSTALPAAPKSITRYMGIAPGDASASDRTVSRLGHALSAIIADRAAKEPQLNAPLIPAVGPSRGGTTLSEAVVAVEMEGAATALDVIRRSPALHIDAKACYASVPSVVSFMAKRFQWDRTRSQWEERAAKDFVASYCAP